MQHHLFWVVFVAYFSCLNNCETKRLQEDNVIPYVLSQLFEDKNRPPIILYLEPKSNFRTFEEYQGDLRSPLRSPQYDDEAIEEEENYQAITQNDERAYILYHLLRTTVQEENIDPSGVQRLQRTKEFLRQALVGRCRKLNKCFKECPKPKVKQVCIMQCKQIFDDLDECDQPIEEPIEMPKKKCKSVKCGHTMPPDWRYL